IETPAVDRLAAEGFVFDQFLADSLAIDSLYRSCWFGRHAMTGDVALPPLDEALPAIAKASGAQPVLLTDDPLIAGLPGAAAFSERILLPMPSSAVAVAAAEATSLAGAFVRLIGRIESFKGRFFVWCHLGSLGRVWDAPWEMRRQYAEAGDPDPPAAVDVPSLVLDGTEDPDLVWGLTQAYAGQVSLLDLCVGALISAIAEAPWGRDTALALLGLRGFSLGEHGRVGRAGGQLGGESIHVPLLVRLPDPTLASARSQCLVQTPDLYATWREILTGRPAASCLGAASLVPLIREETETWRDRSAILGPDSWRGFRTPAWYFLKDQADRLFAKPDDRWEVNDVADRHADIATALAGLLAEYESRLRSGSSEPLTPLDEILREGFR
ncbi:MAG: hypothetical protein PHO07_17445, partial [Pirellulales bacterium]|nr:hypothetical protein [Pirellulales bacterium]